MKLSLRQHLVQKLGRRIATLVIVGACLSLGSAAQASSANEALTTKREEQNTNLGSPTSFFFRAQPGKATSRAFYENRWEHLRVPTTESPETEYSLTGESLKPGILVHHHSFGFGLFANVGSHKVKNTTPDRQVHSSIRHRGLGVELTFLPGSDKNRSLGFYLRGSILHANQDVIFDSAIEHPNLLPKSDYLVYEGEVGAHYKIEYWDFLFIYPWISYQMRSIDFQELDSGSSEVEKGSYIYDDAKSTWDIRPVMRYGIDVAIKVYAFDIHIGNGLRHLANLSHPKLDSKTYQSKTFSLSLSYTSRTN